MTEITHEALEALSKAATQGVWRATPLGGSSTVLCEERPKRNDTRIPAYAYRDEHCLAYPFIEEDLRARWDFVCFSHDDANLIVALVNAYRTGQLVPAQPSGDVVEAVARTVAEYQIGVGLPSDDAWEDAHGIATAAITAYEAALRAKEAGDE